MRLWKLIRAAAAFQNSGLGKSLLVGREEIIKTALQKIGLEQDKFGDSTGVITEI